MSLSVMKSPPQSGALESCEREPIHLLGKIQPNGILFIVGDDDFTIQHVSENLLQLFPYLPNEVIGAPLARLLGEAAIEEIRHIEGLGQWRSTAIHRIAIPHSATTSIVVAQVARHDSLWLIDLEWPVQEEGTGSQTSFQPVRDVLWQLESEDNLERYAKVVADQIRLLTGFDRVLIYRFDTHWDGEVIAESIGDGLSSLLGHHFPASDIPAQARALYSRTAIRLVADIQAVPVAMLPGVTASSQQPPDLTFSALRAMSPVHLEYLHNMGVRASMSISLMQNNRLWGLINCHHLAPRYLSLQRRELIEFIGRTVSNKLSNLEYEQSRQTNQRIAEILSELKGVLAKSPQLLEAVQGQQHRVLELLNADGVILCWQNQTLLLGRTPSMEAYEPIAAWLFCHCEGDLFHTDCLSTTFPDALDMTGVASGMVWLALDRLKGYSMAWFRGEILHSICWAGAPEKRLSGGDEAPRLSPRKSFASWMETVHATSRPWLQAELQAAESLVFALMHLSGSVRQALSSGNELLLYSSDLLGKLDSQGRLQLISPACRHLLGQIEEQLLGQPLASYIAPEAQSQFFDTLERVKRERRQEIVVLPIVSTASIATARWIEWVFQPLASDAAMEVVLSGRDVTGRYSYQLALEELRRRDSVWSRVANPSLLVVDCHDRILYANPEAAVLLQQSVSGLIGMPLEHCVHYPEATQARSGACQLLLSNQERLDAIAVWAQVQHTQAGAAEIQGVLTLRMVAVEQTVAQQLAMDAVLVTDAHSTILGFSPSFADISGYGADELLDNTPRMLRSGVHTSGFYSDLWSTLRQQGHWQGEIWNRRKSGEIYPQWGSISAIQGGTSTYYVAVFSDISRLQQAEQQLYFLANHDPLTGLPNRARFNDQLTQALERSKRSGRMLALAFIDLDYFKSINDSLGHALGDLYLKMVAERLQAVLRQQDFLARWGGDEFLALFEDIQQSSEVAGIIKRMRERVGEPFVLGGRSFRRP